MNADMGVHVVHVDRMRHGLAALILQLSSSARYKGQAPCICSFKGTESVRRYTSIRAAYCTGRLSGSCPACISDQRKVCSVTSNDGT